MTLSSNEENNTGLKWSKYSRDYEFFELKSEKNIKELVQFSYKEKNIRNFLKYSGLFIFYGCCYYTWNIWRWFTPEFYEKLYAVFFLSLTDQEETTIQGWFSYIIRNKPRQIKQNFQEAKIKIIDNWTIEATIRLVVFPVAIIIGCFQASYLRYSFLSNENKKAYINLSWQDFKKQPFRSIEKKELIFYDKFILIHSKESNNNYCVNLPVTISNKNIYETIKNMLKQPSRKKLQTKNKSSKFHKTKIVSKPKLQYKRNLFRHLRSKALINKTKLPELTFNYDPSYFYPGFISNLSLLVNIYAVLFPIWFISKVWFRITNTTIDIRKTKAKKVRKSQNKKRLSDLAGIEKLLPDLSELVETLNKKGNKSNLSIYAPKGYILVGPPGTGKTLLAQAIAGESNVTFFFSGGCEFLENQNGIGPARLRDLFRKAKKESPAIIFIDEIDTLGKARTGSVNSLTELGSNYQGEEKIQILTEFLVQMDGFSKRNDLIVIGATNFFELLDPAFIRPGRFDRIFQLELPTKAVRIDILKLHALKKGFDPSIPWNYFGRITNGFSGADLSAIVNESLLRIIRDKEKIHTFETLQHGLNRISTYSLDNTLIKNSSSVLSQTRKAYYQSGIGLIYSFLPELPNQLCLELHPRPKNLRFLKLEKQLKTLQFDISNKKILEAKVLGFLSGIAAEFYVFNELSSINKTGEFFWVSQQGVNDLEKATKIVTTMIDTYGMFDSSIIALNFNPFVMNSTFKRFSVLESTSYNKVWNLIQDDFLSLVNEEEDREKPIRMNWRFLSFWSWQLTSQNIYLKDVPKWSKSYVDEEILEDQQVLIGDDYFHKNQILQYHLSLYEKRDNLVSSVLKKSFDKVLVYLKTHRSILDLLAYLLLVKGRLIEDEILEIISKTKKIPDKTFITQQKVLEDLFKIKN